MLGIFVVARPCIGQLDAARVADEQRGAQGFFELLDVTGERRLRDVHLQRSAAKAFLFGDGYEIAQKTQLDGVDSHLGISLDGRA